MQSTNTEVNGFNETQLKTLIEAINLITTELMQDDTIRLEDLLALCLAPIEIKSMDFIARYLNPVMLVPILYDQRIPPRVRTSAEALLQRIRIIDMHTLDQEKYNLLTTENNTNPSYLYDLQMFSIRISKFNKTTQNAMIRLRELFLEMTPLHEVFRGDFLGSEIPICIRIGKVPCGLDKMGSRPRDGHIQNIVKILIENNLDLQKEFQNASRRKHEYAVQDFKEICEFYEAELSKQKYLLLKISKSYSKLKKQYIGGGYTDEEISLLLSDITKTIPNMEYLEPCQANENLESFILQEINHFQVRRSTAKANKLNVNVKDKLVIVFDKLQFDWVAVILSFGLDDKPNNIQYFDPLGFFIPVEISAFFKSLNLPMGRLVFSYPISSRSTSACLIEGIRQFVTDNTLSPEEIDVIKIAESHKELIRSERSFLYPHVKKSTEMDNGVIVPNFLGEDSAFLINLNYCYSDDDINTYINTSVEQELDGYDTQCVYLLRKDFVEKNNRKKYRVAITPAVCAHQQEFPLSYFFDAALQPMDAICQALNQLVKERVFQSLSILKNQELHEKLCLYLDEQKIDTDIIKLIGEILVELNFDEEKITNFTYQRNLANPRIDVFHEIMPYLRERADRKVKILFPFNDQDRFHWLLGEVIIHHLKNNEYLVKIQTHDPYGRGQLKDVFYQQLKSVIIKKINSYFSESLVRVSNVESEFTPRQNRLDTTSCGIIVSEDLLKRIVEESLDVLKPFPIGAKMLRKSHYEKICTYGQGASRDAFLRNATIASKNTPNRSVAQNTVSSQRIVLPHVLRDHLQDEFSSKNHTWIKKLATTAATLGRHDILEVLLSPSNNKSEIKKELLEYEELQKETWKWNFLSTAYNSLNKKLKTLIDTKPTLSIVSIKLNQLLTTTSQQAVNLFSKKFTTSSTLTIVNGEPIYTNLETVDESMLNYLSIYYKAFISEIQNNVKQEVGFFCKEGANSILDLAKWLENRKKQADVQLDKVLLNEVSSKKAIDEKIREFNSKTKKQQHIALNKLIREQKIVLPEMLHLSDNDSLWTFVIDNYFLKSKISVYYKDEDGNTLLHLAILNGQTATALHLLNYYRFLDLKIKNRAGETMFQVKDKYNNTLLNYCLTHAKDSYTNEAKERRYIDLAFELIELGARLDLRNQKDLTAVDITDKELNTVLHHGILERRDDIVLQLLAHGASLTNANQYGQTAWDLIFGIEEDSKGMMKLY